MMKNEKNRSLTGFLCLVMVLGICCFLVQPTRLNGQYRPFYTYYNFIQGSKSLGMANAFTAVADDLTTIARNPAGLTNFLYPALYMTASSKSSKQHYETQQQDFLGYSQELDAEFSSKLKNIDFLAVTAPVVFWDMKFNFALSFQRSVPYGQEGYFKQTLNTISEQYEPALENLSTITGGRGFDILSFSAAFFLLDDVSFGITWQQYLNSGSRTFSNEFDFPATFTPSSATNDQATTNSISYTDKLEGRSFIFGMLVKLVEEVSIGISYHTPLNGTLEQRTGYTDAQGHLTELSTTGDIYIPAKLSIGTNLRLLKQFDLAYEFSRIYWTKGKTGELAFPVLDKFSFNQADIVNHRIGLQLSFPFEKLALFFRCGLSWDRQLFRGADDALLRLKGYALGAGLYILPRFMLDIGFMHQRANWMETGYFDPAAQIPTKYRDNIISIGISYHFFPKIIYKKSHKK